MGPHDASLIGVGVNPEQFDVVLDVRELESTGEESRQDAVVHAVVLSIHGGGESRDLLKLRGQVALLELQIVRQSRAHVRKRLLRGAHGHLLRRQRIGVRRNHCSPRWVEHQVKNARTVLHGQRRDELREETLHLLLIQARLALGSGRHLFAFWTRSGLRCDHKGTHVCSLLKSDRLDFRALSVINGGVQPAGRIG